MSGRRLRDTVTPSAKKKSKPFFGSDEFWVRNRGRVEKLHKITNSLDSLTQSFRLLNEARGPFMKGVAAVSIAANLLEMSVPDRTLIESLTSMGWTRAVRSCRDLVHQTLKDLHEPQEMKTGEDDTALFWELDGEPAVYSFENYETREIWEREPGCLARLMDDLWTRSLSWCMEEKVNKRGWHSAELTPLEPVSAPHSKEADDLRSWLRKTDSFKRTRMVMLVGPTGVGKTTAARTAVGSTKTLQVPSGGDPAGILALTEILQPDVVLLDDVLFGKDLDQQLSGLLDRLQGKARLVFVTFMADSLTEEDTAQPGGLYWPGMRPGRLDRVVFMSPPGDQDRRRIFESCGAQPDQVEELVALSAGLTGAFLIALQRRVELYPEVPIREHAKTLRCMAPASFSAGED